MNQLKNYSIQVLCFAVVILIVVLVSGYVTAGHKDKEQKKVIEHYQKQLKKTEEFAQKRIEQLHNELYEIKRLKKEDSLSINRLQYKLQQNEAKLEKERKQAVKMTNDEKKTYLLNRYSN